MDGMKFSIRVFTGLAGIIAFLAGCASDPTDQYSRELSRMRSSEPPTFLAGDIASAFSGANFSARVEIQRGAAGMRPPEHGELSGRDGSLYFMADEQRMQRGIAGGMSAFWDASMKTGYLLNDPLQAYAPIRLSQTNAPLEVAAAGEEAINGEATHKFIGSLRVGNELVPRLVIWRSATQGDLPIRVQTTNDPANLTLTLSRVRPGPAPKELFEIPSGFKKYETTEAMMSDLIARRSARMEGERRAKNRMWKSNPDDEDDPLLKPPTRPY